LLFLDPGWVQDQGSGINIPDPQHWFVLFIIVSKITFVNHLAEFVGNIYFTVFYLGKYLVARGRRRRNKLFPNNFA
jgi:hypothetical protein